MTSLEDSFFRMKIKITLTLTNDTVGSETQNSKTLLLLKVQLSSISFANLIGIII